MRPVLSFNKIFKRFAGMQFQNFAIVASGPSKVRVEKLPVPSPRENELLVRVQYVSLSTLDIHQILHGPMLVFKEKSQGHIIGSQTVGLVIGMGKEVGGGWEIGDRVVLDTLSPCGKCRNCLANKSVGECMKPYMLGIPPKDGVLTNILACPSTLCHRIDKNVSMITALITPRMAICIEAYRLSQLSVLKKVAIIGQGMLGLIMVAICRILGIQKLFYFDTNVYNLELAEDIGADYAIKYRPLDQLKFLRSMIIGLGDLPTITIDTFGSFYSQTMATWVTERGGKVMIIGYPGDAEGIFQNNPNLMSPASYEDLDILQVRGYGPSMSFVPRVKTSVVWEQFEQLDQDYTQCKICNDRVSYKSSTSNLKKHLARRHPTVKIITAPKRKLGVSCS